MSLLKIKQKIENLDLIQRLKKINKLENKQFFRLVRDTNFRGRG